MRVIFAHRGRENLGIEYLSAILKKHGHRVALAYDPGLFSTSDNILYSPALENFFSNKNIIFKKILDFAPDVVAFSVYTATYQWCSALAREIKKASEAKIVFGGIHPTLVPEKVISNEFIDFVVVGEAELAFSELINSLESKDRVDNIKNVWFRQNNKIIRNEVRQPADIDTLPIPDKKIFEKYANYRDDYLIMTGRGCMFDCNYCCESYINKIYCKKFFRRRKISCVIEELQIMKERYNYKEVHFNSPVFFTDKEWVRDFLIRFKVEIGVPFKCFGQVLFLSEEIAELLKWAGCYNIEFGIQSVSENIRKEILNRSETNLHIRKALAICDSYKLRYDIDHIFGLPGEKEENWVNGATFYSQCKCVNRIKCHNLTYFPSLSIVQIAQGQGILSKAEVEDIEEGKRKDDFFHLFIEEDSGKKRLARDFQVFYKILPLLKPRLIRRIIHHQLYKKFHLFPFLAVMFLQVLIALRGRDYRFLFYFKNYPIKIAKALIVSIKYKICGE